MRHSFVCNLRIRVPKLLQAYARAMPYESFQLAGPLLAGLSSSEEDIERPGEAAECQHVYV